MAGGSTNGPAPSAGPLAVRMWDGPVRIVHWLFVLAIPALWWTAENDLMAWHMRIGIAMLGLLVFRLLWGLLGSSTARFAKFVKGPRTVIGYLRGSANYVPTLGHNPAGALSVVALLGVMGLQVALGLVAGDPDDGVAGPLNAFVSVDAADAAGDLHESLFNVLLGLIGLHVAALAYYRLVKGERLVGAMVTGRIVRPGVSASYTPVARWRVAVCAALSVAVAWWVWSGAAGLGVT